jgi:hypothetical protein
MRPLRWILLIAELIMLVLVSVVPPMDLPQTAFNEADTPINQATVPVILGCRRAISGLRAAGTTARLTIRPRFTHSAVVPDTPPAQSARSYSLLALLCSFLC